MANKETILQNQNEDTLKLLVADIRKKLDIIRLGGGQKNIDKLHAKGKLSARERVEALVDKDAPIIEIGAFAGYEMYPEHGGCPAGGVVVVMGYVAKRLCIIVANDATVKSGAWFPISGKKNLRAQEIAMENHLPIIYLVDSAGVYLPMQDEIFADKEHFGRIFRNNAVMSSKGIPQISAVMGACVAGGAYLPIMSDEALIVEETGSIFLAGPFLVKAAIGENIDAETLGGATTHNVVSGVTDYKMKNDEECLAQIRRLVDKMGKQGNAGFDRKDAKAPGRAAEEILQLFPADGKPYNMKDIIECMVDADSFDEYKEHYGKTIMTGYARIDGWAVGIVANNRLITKNGKGEVQMGGVIYSDSADKAARFIMNCNQKNIPLVFLQDVTGFMVGSRSEHGGIIKDGAKLVNAMANSVVPKFTVIVGNSYGAGNYAMCGKAYDPRLIVAWPTAKIAVMGGEQAAKTLLQIQVGSMKAKGQEISPAEEKELLDKITAKYTAQTKATYAASRLWVDAIIDPRETRQWLSMGIEAAFNNPEYKRYNVGVLQT